MGSRGLSAAAALRQRIAAGGIVLALSVAVVRCGGDGEARPAPADAAGTEAGSPTAPAQPTVTSTPVPDPLLNRPDTPTAAVAGVEAVTAETNSSCPEQLKMRWEALCGTADIDGDRVADRSGDATAEIAVIVTRCSAGVPATGPECAGQPVILRWDSSAWRDIGPGDGARVDNLQAANFQGSGAASVLVPYGGALKNERGAGPQRKSTTSYELRSGRYVVTNVTPDRALYLYHSVLDADTLFGQNEFEKAAAAYESAVTSTTLRDWKAETGKDDGRAELIAYARFRAMVATAAARKDPRPAYDEIQRAAPVGAPEPAALFATAAQVFLAGYTERGGVHAGCVEATEYLAKVTDRINAYFAYGYDAELRSYRDMCPL